MTKPTPNLEEQLRVILKNSHHTMSGTPLEDMAGWGFGYQIKELLTLIHQRELEARIDELKGCLRLPKFQTIEVIMSGEERIKKEHNATPHIYIKDKLSRLKGADMSEVICPFCGISDDDDEPHKEDCPAGA
jgi:hypothetical protein